MSQTAQRPQPARQQIDPARRPVEKFRDGPVHVSIREKSGTKGAFRMASLELRYRGRDDEWLTGKSYTSNALLHLESAAREARSRIERWQQSTTAKLRVIFDSSSLRTE